MTAVQDAIAVDEKAIPGKDLIPVRAFLRASEIPPADVGAYGVVVLQSKATAASRAKLLMVCQSFIAHFPRSETLPQAVPITDRMITIWPVDNPESDKARSDDCDFAIDHYDLFAAESAIADAQHQHARFDGTGPFLVGWSPSNARGKPDQLVLVINMSADNTQKSIDNHFLFWKNKIVQNPSLWRNGFSVEGIRLAIHDFADQYGKDMVDAIKLIGFKR